MRQMQKGVAMIELIFSLVVMGIVMMSAPMLINKATESSYLSFQQESIATAAAQINMIMTAEWDDADTNNTLGEPVLLTASNTLNQCKNAAGVLIAHPVGVTSASGRYCTGSDGNYYNATIVSKLGPEGTEGMFYDDVDDYNNATYNVAVYHNEATRTYTGDYMDKNLTVTSKVYYGDDVPRKKDGTASAGGYDKVITFANPFRAINPAQSTNIKLISVKLTSDNTASELRSKEIHLSAFLCNIGAPKPNLISNKGIVSK
jgi:type II secretory pathway pseudopilin PulG